VVTDGADAPGDGASSHALDQKRLAGLTFSVGVLRTSRVTTSIITATMESYLAAKKLLFDSLSSKATAVVNRDDPAAGCDRKNTQARFSGTV
jgi:UDP-N-acetylmuramoyl-L-alanyl-D-glutamate--2,6-diaminopimelate ligase